MHLWQSLLLLQSNESVSEVATSQPRRQESSEYESNLGPPSVSLLAVEHLPRLPVYGNGSAVSHEHESDAIVRIILGHVLNKARSNSRCDKKNSNIFWPRFLVPEFQPREGRIMAFEYDAISKWRDQGRRRTLRFARQSLFATYLYSAAQGTGDSEPCMDCLPQSLDGDKDGRRERVQDGDVDKHYQLNSSYWSQQEINSEGNAFVAMMPCKKASNSSADDMLQSGYMAGLEQAIKFENPSTVDSPGSRDFAGFPRYHRLLEVLGSLTYRLVAISYPMTVSGAAIPPRYSLCSNGIYSLPSPSLNVYRKLKRPTEPTPLNSTVDSNIVSILPWSPENNLLQYLALCSLASLLIGVRGTGAYLRYSFMASGGFLALICLSAGTETMLRFLPWVVLLMLFASLSCEVFMNIFWGLPRHEAGDELVTISGYAIKTTSDKVSRFVLT